MEKGTTTLSREDRERIAYDEGDVWETSNTWHQRFSHVFHCPNTVAHDQQYLDWIHERVAGSRVLDIGCGRGVLSCELASRGAKSVVGIDISVTEVGFARASKPPDNVEFVVGSIELPIEGTFDLICGHSILHHIDYRKTLVRLYEENLAPGGAMVFQEPLGGSVLIRIFTKLVPKAHTPDERSFMKADLKWFKSQFPDVRLVPFNWLSLTCGILSSKFSKKPDNLMMRIADRFDRMASSSLTAFSSQFRRCNIMVTKPLK